MIVLVNVGNFQCLLQPSQFNLSLMMGTAHHVSILLIFAPKQSTHTMGSLFAELLLLGVGPALQWGDWGF